MTVRIYIHWPFCVRKCPYCDFTSKSVSPGLKEEYFGCLLKEIGLWAWALRGNEWKAESLYFGGGTPSTLSPEELGRILDRLTEVFSVGKDTEITVEVNPGTWRGSDLNEAAARGINRFSLGLQSLDDCTLQLLGRIHSAQEGRDLLSAALSLEGVTVNVDLIYGLPRGGDSSFLKSLAEVLCMRPHHVSIYPLTLSACVPMAGGYAEGKTSLPEEDFVAAEYEAAVELLQRHGYVRYEISNFCLPGHECHHNLGYWRREDYLGFGVSAHSFLGGVRWRNSDLILKYVSSLRQGVVPVEDVRPLEPHEEEVEEMILGLRLEEGIEASLLRGRTEVVEELEGLGLLRRWDGRISLTTKGMLLQSEVLVRLMPA